MNDFYLEPELTEEEWTELRRKKKIVKDWKDAAKALRKAANKENVKMLLRESRNIALCNIENAARTEQAFKDVVIIYNAIDLIEYDRIRKHEKRWLPDHEFEEKDELANFEVTDMNNVIPHPFDHEYWRQMQSGNFLDIIHDCPHDIPEMTSSRQIHNLTKDLDEEDKELMYYKIIRRWSTEMLAIRRNQSERNILKVYSTIINNIRWNLYVRLHNRYKKKKPLTLNQKKFMEWYWEQLSNYQQQKIMRQIEDNRRLWFSSVREAGRAILRIMDGDRKTSS